MIIFKVGKYLKLKISIIFIFINYPTKIYLVYGLPFVVTKKKHIHSLFALNFIESSSSSVDLIIHMYVSGGNNKMKT